MDLRAKPAKSLKQACILIVEDDFLIYLSLESTLTSAGARIAGHCSSIDEALTFVDDLPRRRKPPGRQLIAILDIRLREGTTLGIAQQLRENGVPLLFYSGQGDWQAVKQEFSEAPRLAKPAFPAELVGAVSGLLQ